MHCNLALYQINIFYLSSVLIPQVVIHSINTLFYFLPLSFENINFSWNFIILNNLLQTFPVGFLLPYKNLKSCMLLTALRNQIPKKINYPIVNCSAVRIWFWFSQGRQTQAQMHMHHVCVLSCCNDQSPFFEALKIKKNLLPWTYGRTSNAGKFAKNLFAEKNKK